MFTRAGLTTALIGSLALGPLAGCEGMSKKEQGALIGAGAGAGAGALIAKDNRGLGALIGAAVGGGAGYLIGAQQDKIDKEEREEARQAADRAARNPASRDDVDEARTADLNDDGFVTMDEVVAMEKADLSDAEQIERLRRTDQVFELTASQQEQLRDKGVSQRVIDAMLSMNRYDARTASDRYDNRVDRY